MEEIKNHLEHEFNRTDNAWWQSLTLLESKEDELKKLQIEVNFLKEDVIKYEKEKEYFQKMLNELNEKEK
jgi:hypothetical protein